MSDTKTNPGEMSNFDIDKAFTYRGRKNPRYGGTFCKNELLSEVGRPGKKIYIVNLQDSTAGPGSHWTICDNLNPNYTVYCDSFGVAPPIEVEKFLKMARNKAGERKKILYNTIEIQDLDSSYCGHFCVFIGKMRLRGYKLSTIIDRFDIFHTKLNDKLVSKIKKSKYEGEI